MSTCASITKPMHMRRRGLPGTFTLKPQGIQHNQPHGILVCQGTGPLRVDHAFAEVGSRRLCCSWRYDADILLLQQL